MSNHDELAQRLRDYHLLEMHDWDLYLLAADAITQLQRDNAALMEDAAAQVQIAREAVERAAGLRQAIATACEGWTLPSDVRKILETALWSQVVALGDPITKPRKPIPKLTPRLIHCAASQDGECNHEKCPQLRDNEPNKSGRHCPLDVRDED